MHLVELAIEAFQALERARIRFGPGLNVLYGPNDLGKSTLVAAIRGALLVPPRAAEAKHYASWYADAAPQVRLTLVDDEERFWQIRKTFGGSTSAELACSKDGKQYAIDCKSREVEEKVRALLGWGVPAPGGKGGQKGLPQSFLATVLLAAQTDVDAILGASLEADADDGGRIRLRKALATLAQDPQFKRVLDCAQQEYDVYFTAKGNLRRTQGSKLVEADLGVKAQQAERERLRREQEESRGVEDQARGFRDACLQAEAQLAEAETQLASIRAGQQNALALEAARLQLAVAQEALVGIDAQAARVSTLEQSHAALRDRLQQQQRALDAADVELAHCTGAQHSAEEALRALTSDAAEQARKLRAAELNAEAAELDAQQMRIGVERDEAARAAQAQRERHAAQEALAAARAQLTQHEQRLPQVRDALASFDQEVDLARAVLAYGRYRQAEEATQRAQALRDRLGGLQAQAARCAAESDALLVEAQQRAAALEPRRAGLPSPERLAELQTLWRELEIAEAALGGGMSVALEPRTRELRVSAEIDGAPAAQLALPAQQPIEAERRVRLTIGDLIEIEVSAGSAAQRHAVSELRQRWQAEATPWLERSEVAAIQPLTAAVEALRHTDDAVRALAEQGHARALEAQALREQAALLVAQLEGAPSLDVVARRAAIGSIALELLEPRWRKLGAHWEARAESELEACRRRQADARESANELEQQLQLARYRVQEAERGWSARLQAGDAPSVSLEGADPVTRERELEGRQRELEEQRRALEGELSGLDREAGAVRSRVEAQLSAAQAERTRALDTQGAARVSLEKSQAALHTLLGELKAEAEQLARLERPAAVQRREACAALVQARSTLPLASADDVAGAELSLQHAERALDEQRAELHKAEGALTKVGGAQLHDRLQQIEEALELALAQERELKVDAEAWRLLRDALKAAENEESEHLGVALARPVGDKLYELTQGRYAELTFDQSLAASGLRAAGAAAGADVLDALSVGTRHQLATLIRLIIASQLRSTIILDDHLVHTDPARLAWFRALLRTTALQTQVLIFTCRPQDYLDASELATDHNPHDVAGGSVRATDLGPLVQRWSSAAAE